jgi:hypothetical protein
MMVAGVVTVLHRDSPANLNLCSTVVFVNPDGWAISMLFTSFFLEPEYDWLEIFDGPATSPSTSIGYFTYRELAGQRINSTSGA